MPDTPEGRTPTEEPSEDEHDEATRTRTRRDSQAEDALRRDSEDQIDDDVDGFLGSLPEAVQRRVEALVPELVKKTFAAGMGAVFQTEEGIRKMARDVTLPKEVAGYLVDTAGATKDEVFRIIAREIREFLESVNLGEEIARMLTTLSFEIKTEIRFIPNDEKLGGVSPDVKANVSLKKNDEQVKPKSRFRRRRRTESDENE